MAHSRLARQNPGKILTLWTPKLHLLLWALSSPLLFVFTAQVMSSEDSYSHTELASWTGMGSSAGFAFLGSHCPVLGDNLQHTERATQGRSPQPPGPCSRVTLSGPWAAPGSLDHHCFCSQSPSQPQAGKHREAFLEWDAFPGVRREEWSSLVPSSLSPPLTESWVNVGFVSAFLLAKEITVTNFSLYVLHSVSGIRSFSGKQK